MYQQLPCLSAAHDASTVRVGPSPAGSQCFSGRLHVLEVRVLCGLRLVVSIFSGIVLPGCGAPRLPLQRLRLFSQRPPSLIDKRDRLGKLVIGNVGEGARPLGERGWPWREEVGPWGEGARAWGVCLLAGYFPGIVAFGSCSPGGPLQSLSLLLPLRCWHALISVPEEVRKDHTDSFF